MKELVFVSGVGYCTEENGVLVPYEIPAGKEFIFTEA